MWTFEGQIEQMGRFARMLNRSTGWRRRVDKAAGYDPDARLPDDAVDSGFRRDGVSLWHVPGDQSAVWLASGATAERWPRGEPPLCL